MHGTRTPLLYPAPSSNLVAEVLEEALELGMLAGEAGPFSPPDAREVPHRPHGQGADGGVPESAGVRLVQRR